MSWSELPAGILANLSPALRVVASGSNETITLRRGGDRSGERVLRRYAVAPSLGNPRVLLPLDASTAALATVLKGHVKGASSPLVRASARGLQLLSYLGLAPLLLRDRVLVSTRDLGLQETSLHAFLGGVLGHRAFVTSMRIAPDRPNGKPVVQAVACNGDVLAYAKFGSDALTCRLIRHEAEVLGRLAPLTMGMPLRVPPVLFSGTWQGMETVILAPLSNRGVRLRSAAEVPVTASVVLAGLETRTIAPLASSRFWRRTAGQARRVLPLLSADARQVVEAACRLCETDYAGINLPMGRSHGDWIAPNMAITADGAFNVWDWERSEADVPLGTDLLQFILQFELRRSGHPSAIIERTARFAAPALVRHGLDRATWPVLAALSLLRTILWYGEAREAGREGREAARPVAALAALLNRQA